MPKTSTAKDHLEISREAGFGRVSFISVLAGLISAYGAFAIVAAIVGAVLSKVSVNTEFRTNDWTGSGAVALLASAVTLLLAYLFGGYVAGRMARRAGVLHGILVFVATLVVGAIVGGVVALLTDNSNIKSNLRSIGVPTSTSQIKGVAITGVAVSLAAILVGAVLGGMLGERWHTKLARRAADPEIGPAADARARAVEEEQLRQERLARDPLVRRDVPSDESVVHHTVPVAETRAVGDERDAEPGGTPRHARDEDRIDPGTGGAIRADDPPTTFQDQTRLASDEQRRDRGEPNR
jgi:hypothetical protein